MIIIMITIITNNNNNNNNNHNHNLRPGLLGHRGPWGAAAPGGGGPLPPLPSIL